MRYSSVTRKSAQMIFTAILLIIVPLTPSHSEWAENGTLICDAMRDQLWPDIASDGKGGAFITWYDFRSQAYHDIFTQYVAPDGTPLWTSNGVAVSVANRDQTWPRLAAGGSGGVFIVWQDERYYDASGIDIYAQRFDSDGNYLWMINGRMICGETGNQFYPHVISDGDGGAIIAWTDERSGNRDVYAQRVDSDGNVLWDAGGIAVSTGAPDQFLMDGFISDGSGGAFIGWQEQPAGANWNVGVQRISSSGNLLWGAGGVYLSSPIGRKSSPALTRDDAGGIYAAWQDQRDDEGDIYTQRIDADGNPLWTADGIPLCTETYLQAATVIASDGAGGAIVAWWDIRSTVISQSDIYAQRIDSLGNTLWAANGAPVTTASAGQLGPDIVADGNGGAIIAWEDNLRSTRYDIYAQRLDAAGVAQWTASGVSICSVIGDQYQQRCCSDGRGGMIVAWPDRRDGNRNIYASRIDGDGDLVTTFLQNMSSHVGQESITLEWTLSDAGTGASFFISRREVNSGDLYEINDPIIDREGERYIYMDTSVRPGSIYRYTVDIIDKDGRRTLFETDRLAIPEIPLTLYQNHPNPFNPSTSIRFHLPEAAHVHLSVYDVSGRQIAVLADEFITDGTHEIGWDGRDSQGSAVESGIYLYNLKAGKKRLSRKMLLLR
jgi:hypothetical protein